VCTELFSTTLIRGNCGIWIPETGKTMVLGSRGWSMCKADHLTTICELVV
jgi:hypothetical protein